MVRAEEMAKRFLSEGMLNNRTLEDINEVIRKISSPTGYGSHGAVIDKTEAESLGLSVEWLEPDSII